MPEEQDNETLISHLEALREMLLKCVISLAVGLLPSLFIAPKALDWLIKIIISDSKVMLNYFSPTEVFIIQIKTAVVIDLIICFPYIMKKIWDFVLPALYENERKFIKSVVLLSSSLFVLGVAFCVFVILPLIIKFGISFATSNVQAVFGISNVVTLSLWLSVVFGLMFQMPLLTHALIKFGIVDYDTISDKRPYVIVILLIIAAILTPPDVLSQVLLFTPTYLLFEIGLLCSEKYRKKEHKNESNE